MNYIKIIVCSLVFLLGIEGLSAQQKYTISGYVKDAKSGEALIGAGVYVAKIKRGISSNAYGFYSLTIPADSYVVAFTYIGYKPQFKKILLNTDIKLNLLMTEITTEIGEATVTAHKKDNIEKPQVGVIDIPIKQVKELPAIFGEKDLMKIIQLLPGVQSGSEASAGYYVRGGGPDQNLVLLDEAVIYNPFHLAGFFSVFNGDAIRSVSLIKGGFPAQYGGRLSSILDISMKDGNDKEYHGEGGLGLISSRLCLEGPIVKEKSSFMISGRRTYVDYLIRPFLPIGVTAGYYFYDLNAKVDYKISEKDKVYLSSYLGKDVFYYTGKVDSTHFQFDWGNKSVTTRWNHLFSDKLFSNLTGIYNDYLSRIQLEAKQQGMLAKIKLVSGIKDIGGKYDFDYFPNIRHKIKFGAQYTFQTFIPSTVKFTVDTTDLFKNETIRKVHNGALYFNDEFELTDKVSLSAGVRFPLFFYKTTHYTGIEPRVTVKCGIDDKSSVKLGYTWMNQYMHLVSNSSASIPLDLWLPSSDFIKPQQAQQGSIGYFRNFLEDAVETSVEVYYKYMNRLIEYKEGADIFLKANVDSQTTFGKGWSYGAEFFVKRNEGRITGWIGYTLSWANRKFPELNNGKTFPAKYDRRNDLSVVGMYEFNKRLSFSAIFVFGAGHSLTLPYGTFSIPGQYGQVFYDYLEKNSTKLKPFNRLDLGIKYTTDGKKWYSEWRLDIYNTYNRRNPYFIYLDNDTDPRSNIYKPVVKQISIFPMIPTVTYNFKF